MDMEELEHTLRKTQAWQEISNLMGRYQYLHTGGQMDRIGRELFAWQRPDATCEYGPLGVFGPEKSLEFFDIMARKFTGGGPECRPGLLEIHQITTPVIEVADDLQTAKGMWMSTGVIMMHEDPEAEEGYSFTWDSGKYAVDFIHTEEGWKIWHLHVCDLWQADFDHDPVANAGTQEYGITQEQIDAYNAAAAAGGEDHPHGFPIPDAPTTFHYKYAADSHAPRQPEPPLPYRSWGDSQRGTASPEA